MVDEHPWAGALDEAMWYYRVASENEKTGAKYFKAPRSPPYDEVKWPPTRDATLWFAPHADPTPLKCVHDVRLPIKAQGWMLLDESRALLESGQDRVVVSVADGRTLAKWTTADAWSCHVEAHHCVVGDELFVIVVLDDNSTALKAYKIDTGASRGPFLRWASEVRPHEGGLWVLREQPERFAGDYQGHMDEVCVSLAGEITKRPNYQYPLRFSIFDDYFTTVDARHQWAVAFGEEFVSVKTPECVYRHRVAVLSDEKNFASLAPIYPTDVYDHRKRRVFLVDLPWCFRQLADGRVQRWRVPSDPSQPWTCSGVTDKIDADLFASRGDRLFAFSEERLCIYQ